MISLLIPWRTDDGPRELAFRYVMGLWADTGYQVCIGEDDEAGPFNRSRALNRAFAQSDGELVVCLDADGVPDTARLAQLDEATPWQPLYAATEYLGPSETAAVYSGADPWAFPPTTRVPACTSILAIRRDVWQAIGGLDERFCGWGCEDVALRVALTRHSGPAAEGVGTYRCLWHPPADVTTEHTKNNIRLVMSEYAEGGP